MRNTELFQIRIAYDFLAAGDEIAQSLALEKTVGKKSQVSKLLENLILGSELLDFCLVGSMSSFLGLTYSSLGILGSYLLLISGILGLACFDYFRVSLCDNLLRLYLSLLSLKNLGNNRILGIDSDIVGSRHVAVEIQATAHGTHLTITTHELILSNDDRVAGLTEIVSLDIIFILLRKDCLKQVRNIILLILREFQLLSVLLRDEIVYRIRIHTAEPAICQFLLKEIHEV